MEVISILFQGGFKNVRARFGWAPAVVLFGRNDAGKSNTLEAIQVVLTDDDDRSGDLVRMPVTSLAWSPLVEAAVIVELTGAPGWSSDAVLAELLQRRPPKIAFDQGRLFRYRLGAVGTEREPNVLEVEGNEIAFGEGPSEFEELRERLRAQLLSIGREECADWPAVVSAYEIVVDACIASRIFLILMNATEPSVHWLGPIGNEDPEVVASAHELHRQRGLWAEGRIPVVDGVVGSLTGGEGLGTFLAHVNELATFRPFQRIRVTSSASGLDELAKQLTDRIAALFELVIEHAAQHLAAGRHADVGFAFGLPVPEVWLAASALADVVWLEELDGGLARVHPLVTALCGAVSKIATEIAPPFISSRHRIVVEPLSPSESARAGGIRLRLLLERGSGAAYEFGVVGSGSATWSGYSLAEAARRLERMIGETAILSGTEDFEPAMRKALGDVDLFAPLGADRERHLEYIPDDAFLELIAAAEAKSSPDRVIYMPPETLYVFDEPERHLHPLAQEEAAAWIASLVREGAFVLVATHALAFLDLPLEQAEYLLVFEDADGNSATESISGDPTGALKRRADRAGVSPAQLIQLTRGILLVEGKHDEQVIEHFYGEDLRRARIEILPIRGTSKTKLLAEAELLRRFRVPLYILFDKTLSTGSDENRAIQTLLDHWPAAEPPPIRVRFGPPDIFFALPEDTVRRVLRGSFDVEFPGWLAIEEGATAAGVSSAKRFFFESLSLPKNQDEVLEAILAESPRTNPVGTALDSSMQELLARATTRRPA